MQVYPTGLLPGIRIEKKLTPTSSTNIRFALQFIDHRDLGVHDNEEGNGYGFSLGYRKFFNETNRGFSLLLRADYWKNTIDWADLNPQISGTSKTTVLQPTALLEYNIRNKSSIIITPSLGFGYEWNIKTIGAPTGKGAILVLGVFIGFQL
ncbi:MAG: hypothetical protein ACI9FN_003179 [Saprospiraceae bacterium]|jgi:hypothetical protein